MKANYGLKIIIVLCGMTTFNVLADPLLDGQTAYEKGDFPRAVGYYLRALRESPNRTPAYYGLAKSHLMQHQNAEAESYITLALATNPDDPAVLELAGHLAMLRDDVVAACSYYQRSTEIDTNRAQAYLGLSGCLRDNNDTAGADAAYANFRRLNPLPQGLSAETIK